MAIAFFPAGVAGGACQSAAVARATFATAVGAVLVAEVISAGSWLREHAG
jgi:hypothetical protein